MTGEMHMIIVKAALRELLEKTPEELRRIEPWLKRKHVVWCLENPIWTTPDNERAMEIIRQAAALLDKKEGTESR